MNPNLRKLAKETKNPDIELEKMDPLTYSDLILPCLNNHPVMAEFGSIKLNMNDVVSAAVLAGLNILVVSEQHRLRTVLPLEIASTYFTSEMYSAIHFTLEGGYVAEDSHMYYHLSDDLDKTLIEKQKIIDLLKSDRLGKNGYRCLMARTQTCEGIDELVDKFDVVLDLDDAVFRGDKHPTVGKKELSRQIVYANSKIRDEAELLGQILKKIPHGNPEMESALRYAAGLKYIVELATGEPVDLDSQSNRISFFTRTMQLRRYIKK
jgi:hypothetical protein